MTKDIEKPPSFLKRNLPKIAFYVNFLVSGAAITESCVINGLARELETNRNDACSMNLRHIRGRLILAGIADPLQVCNQEADTLFPLREIKDLDITCVLTGKISEETMVPIRKQRQEILNKIEGICHPGVYRKVPDSEHIQL